MTCRAGPLAGVGSLARTRAGKRKEWERAQQKQENDEEQERQKWEEQKWDSQQQLFTTAQAEHVGCAADYGGVVGGPACCDQPDKIGSVLHVCLRDAPKCSGYIENSAWGACSLGSA